ncbi:hypothetical protein D3C71_1877090 [compost metagenome]
MAATTPRIFQVRPGKVLPAEIASTAAISKAICVKGIADRSAGRASPFGKAIAASRANRMATGASDQKAARQTPS